MIEESVTTQEERKRKGRISKGYIKMEMKICRELERRTPKE